MSSSLSRFAVGGGFPFEVEAAIFIATLADPSISFRYCGFRRDRNDVTKYIRFMSRAQGEEYLLFEN